MTLTIQVCPRRRRRINRRIEQALDDAGPPYRRLAVLALDGPEGTHVELVNLGVFLARLGDAIEKEEVPDARAFMKGALDKARGPGVSGESWGDAAIREAREELGLDGPIVVPRDEHGSLTPIAELAYERGSEGSAAIWIAWYAVDIGDQKPLPIEGVGVGWFDAGGLLALVGSSGPSWQAYAPRYAILTEPTRIVLPALLEHVRKCASTPAR